MVHKKLGDDQLQDILRKMAAEAKAAGANHYAITAVGVVARVVADYGVRYDSRNMWRRMTQLGWKFRHSPIPQAQRIERAQEAKRQRRKS